MRLTKSEGPSFHSPTQPKSSCPALPWPRLCSRRKNRFECRDVPWAGVEGAGDVDPDWLDEAGEVIEVEIRRVFVSLLALDGVAAGGAAGVIVDTNMGM